ncbi:hypothetical protein HPB51_018830 [Rhipicephalus microplus]|uniref:Uncharacterized protein n=1 Tax=Rhipicephalus microplus TaxID=6941 RepID=A0A9J6DPK9_RHIMP|nr:hypothetical protein HPB51_018830 [Rhipicephalus microplus]
MRNQVTTRERPAPRLSITRTMTTRVGSYLDGGRLAHRPFTQKKKNLKKPERTRKGTREEKRKVSRPSACRRSTGQPSQARFPAQKTPRTDAPSKGDIKVILRPHKGLTVKNLFGSELSVAVIEACRNSFGGESFLLRVHPGSNIIILSTPHEQVAGRLREINQLKIRGRIHPSMRTWPTQKTCCEASFTDYRPEPLRPT